jgi:hypothetical protein
VRWSSLPDGGFRRDTDPPERPNRLSADIRSGVRHVQLFYDGK